MKGIVCLGDKNTHGGHVVSASSTMYINGKQVALVGDIVSCPKHGNNPIIEGAASAFDNGIAIVVDQCLCACGCRVISSESETHTE
ncbi:PAAR domain-containing protein [Providencia vermicola]|uniref:PAAR domain-containing protein n=1 Tax=Providencia stuartii TaxID=588 RepID=A0AAI9HZ82_PROST|nr:MULTISPECIES: PAAR domain-containing protein [Providencia]ELR5045361.1 PAAR domain-containing protein [Providencia rettgeri]ELR5035521.1 PAAR domain-containing protein [Providencia stuartii]ELR5143056.1 PAAR domain-containing protein [Providencia stuartii]ELR5291888.1 PAAR domain-containing protein [Providencia stuartii]MCR4179659.1 PAAR domain-containing protein [Providencia vermicola]